MLGARLKRMRLIVYLGLLFVTPVLIQPVAAQSLTTTVYMPMLISDVDDCTHNEQEQNLVDLLKNAPGQGRVLLTCNTILQHTARLQAQDMATRGYCTAVDPDGVGPNQRVRAAGYALPNHYSMQEDANNVQTVACGYTAAAAMWQAALPNDHLEGQGNFWSQQTAYGIAYYAAPNSQYLSYWVIITAEPAK